MSEIEWVGKKVVLAVHDELLGEHGGPAGIRDEGMLDSALARPRNMVAYDGTSDIATLAAAYAFALTKNHAFADGNKRIAFTTAVVFLRLNGHTLTAARDDCVLTMLSVAGGTLSEAELIAWFRENTAPL
jgi:death-on-curing protein